MLTTPNLILFITALTAEMTLLTLNIYARYIHKPPFIELNPIWRFFDLHKEIAWSQWIIIPIAYTALLWQFAEYTETICLGLGFILCNLLTDTLTLLHAHKEEKNN